MGIESLGHLELSSNMDPQVIFLFGSMEMTLSWSFPKDPLSNLFFSQLLMYILRFLGLEFMIFLPMCTMPSAVKFRSTSWLHPLQPKTSTMVTAHVSWLLKSVSMWRKVGWEHGREKNCCSFRLGGWAAQPEIGFTRLPSSRIWGKQWK